MSPADAARNVAGIPASWALMRAWNDLPSSVCGGMKQTHHVCPQCGTYKGRKVLSVTAK